MRRNMKNNILLIFSLVLVLNGCGQLRKASPSKSSTSTTTVHVDNVYQPSVIVDKESAAPGIINAPAPKMDNPSVMVPTKEAQTKLEKILKVAKSKLGSRYSYSGKGPSSFDCSGFTGYVFRQVGISLGASSRDQFKDGRALAKGEDLRPGDLVFWNGRKIGNTVGHVGIVLDYKKSTGEFTFIHAAVSTGVEIQKSTAEYYARRYMGARRVLPEKKAGEVSEEPAKAYEPITFTATIEPVVAAEEPEVTAEPEPVYHTIKSGDTLSALARKYHTSVSALCSLNGISTKTILKIGRKLRVK